MGERRHGERDAIGDLDCLMGGIVDFEEDICFDTSNLDGTPRNLLDVSCLPETG